MSNLYVNESPDAAVSAANTTKSVLAESYPGRWQVLEKGTHVHKIVCNIDYHLTVSTTGRREV